MASELCCMPSSYFLTKKLTTSIPPIPRLRRTPSTTPSLSIRCSATTQGTNLTADRRTSANFQPSSWSYDFVQSLNNEHLVEEYKEKVEELEEEVRRMINNENVALLNKLELVDEIQRFGLWHRFGDDIRRAVDKIYNFNVRPDQEYYMKLCFLALYNTVNEMVYETLKAKGENVLPYLTKAWSDLCKAFLKEAKWSKSKYSPTFEEYLENAWISASGVVLLVHAYFLSFENITQETLECLENHHNLLRWPSIIFRLSNDLATSTAEIQRGETANSISCSMRDNNVSEECARKYLQAMIEESWKKMNMEMVDGDCPFPKQNVDTAINLARIAQCTYQYGDGHGTPDTRSKNRVLSLIINPID
ncbi:hypothetical protein FEM48_Zijuj04G0081600 [Ziziphus jujuba var. spinosa]|uniref:Uncharacterized protein n=1 Tax=Ziziphus jujuba var. spinosa TaxID=714518 RepID=A0A978VIR7_ZIZJJ|nr:hypothetical protein FEM48_Zijuj04G0081600 [Ziziphus jujuba var. spinosa]